MVLLESIFLFISLELNSFCCPLCIPLSGCRPWQSWQTDGFQPSTSATPWISVVHPPRNRGLMCQKLILDLRSSARTAPSLLWQSRRQHPVELLLWNASIALCNILARWRRWSWMEATSLAISTAWIWAVFQISNACTCDGATWRAAWRIWRSTTLKPSNCQAPRSQAPYNIYTSPKWSFLTFRVHQWLGACQMIFPAPCKVCGCKTPTFPVISWLFWRGQRLNGKKQWEIMLRYVKGVSSHFIRQLVLNAMSHNTVFTWNPHPLIHDLNTQSRLHHQNYKRKPQTSGLDLILRKPDG